MPREHFHETLERTEIDLLEMGELSALAVEQAVAALGHDDLDLAAKVVDEDDAIDAKYMSIEEGTLQMLALQTPVATDLRLVSTILHINLHLERIGDQAVNVAKTVRWAHGKPGDDQIRAMIQEMGDLVVPMVRTSMEAFRRRELELCLKLPEMDDPVDRLNRNMHGEVTRLADDTDKLDWGLHMSLVARHLERVGDNAVDVGEQVGFLLTGKFREFTDASHPVEANPDAD
ncbi:MAG: phosphate signaling complex protein PhoU [Actinomycetota bacterium]